MKVLNSVEVISERLHEAGTSLSKISENESASAQELAATSEQLTESSDTLGMKSDESMDNLGELSEWEGVVADNVEKVEQTSKDLLNKSKDNEKMLNVPSSRKYCRAKNSLCSNSFALSNIFLILCHYIFYVVYKHIICSI
mgnify:CR=1 FL=1